MTLRALAAGTVVRYLPGPVPDLAPGERPGAGSCGWVARGVGECTAIVQEDGALVDTAAQRRLTQAETDTAVVLLHLDDFVELDQSHAFAAWRTYDAEDRARLIVQRGLGVRWLVRKGAEPSRASQTQRVAAARAAVEEAEVRAHAAAEHLTRARADLATLTKIEIVPQSVSAAA